ncbi:helix-hairpin-helix domain-containing protein [Myxococcota bacterium]|nr:helix-hairpin-helix domain-containing protein [Myxococcota bacterium]
MSTKEKEIFEPSIARGVAIFALLSTLISLFVWLWPQSDGADRYLSQNCKRPVEWASEARSRLSCATEWPQCKGLQAGDKIRFKDNKCQRQKGMMRAGMRLLTGVGLNINKASALDLQLLRGVGPSLSQAIVDDRASLGAFTTIDDLVRVHGIGQKTLEKLRPKLSCGEGAQIPKCFSDKMSEKDEAGISDE